MVREKPREPCRRRWPLAQVGRLLCDGHRTRPPDGTVRGEGRAGGLSARGSWNLACHRLLSATQSLRGEAVTPAGITGTVLQCPVLTLGMGRGLKDRQ